MFATDISELTDFGNVGATSVQILWLLGYCRIAMVGVDARYSYIDEKAVSDENGFVLIGEDPDHFCDEYGRGKRRFAHPDLERILGQWPMLANECAMNTIEVRNASPGSALDCFPTTDFASAVAWVLDG